MIMNALIALWNAAIAPVVTAIGALVPSPPSWATSDLTPLVSGMSYLGGFVCWPAVVGAALIVLTWRLAVPALHLLLRVLNVFTLGGFQR